MIKTLLVGKIRFTAALIAAVSIVAVPSVASATGITSVTSSGQSVTTIAAGDQLDVVADGAVLTTGQTTQQITETWSPQSLQLANTSITQPQGWSLEYTTDGMTWSNTPAVDLETVTGVRSTGTVDSLGQGWVSSNSAVTAVQTTTTFNGQAGGDGFNLTFAGDRVYNVFHHASSLRIDCHIKATGAACYGGATSFANYGTPNSSIAYWYAASSQMFVPVYHGLTQENGIACVDFSDLSSPVLCAVPFVPLDTGNNLQNLGTSVQVGTKIFTPNPATWNLMCFDMPTAAACPAEAGTLQSAAGLIPLPHTSLITSGFTKYGRSSYIGGKIFFSTDTSIGCFDPATNNWCASSTPVPITSALVNNGYQFPFFAVRSTSGTLLGACFYTTQQCLDTDGVNAPSIIPGVLASKMTNTALPGWVTNDAGQWAEWNNRLYLPIGPNASGAQASNDVYCFDFTASTECEISGTPTSFAGVGSEIYSIQPDPSVENCLWTNGNAGVITTFDATTGTAGCTLSYALVEAPYTATLPLLGCSENGRVTQWDTLTLDVPAGLTASTLSVTILDSTGVPVPGWVDIALDGSDSVDLSTLTVADTGTRPTFRVKGQLADAVLVGQIKLDISYKSANPQLCMTLSVVQVCPSVTPAPGDATVANGLLRSAMTSTPSGGGSAGSQVQEISLTGTNTSSTCVAVLGSSIQPLPPSETTLASLANTAAGAREGMLTSVIALLLISAGGFILHLTRRRVSGNL